MGTLTSTMEQSPHSRRKPTVVKWAIAVSALLAAINFGSIWIGLAMRDHAVEIVGALTPQIDPHSEDAQPLVSIIQTTSLSIIPVGILFGCLNIALCFAKPKPWVYGAHLLNLIMGTLSVIPAPLCIPILIQWLKPEVKAHFNGL